MQWKNLPFEDAFLIWKNGFPSRLVRVPEGKTRTSRPSKLISCTTPMPHLVNGIWCQTWCRPSIVTFTGSAGQGATIALDLKSSTPSTKFHTIHLCSIPTIHFCRCVCAFVFREARPFFLVGIKCVVDAIASTGRLYIYLHENHENHENLRHFTEEACWVIALSKAHVPGGLALTKRAS